MLAAQAHGGSIDPECGVLGRRHFQIRHEACVVAIVGNFQLFACGLLCCRYLLILVGQQMLGRKVVFDIRKSGQNGLAVAGNRFIVGSLRLAKVGAELAALEQRERQRWADGPEPGSAMRTVCPHPVRPHYRFGARPIH